MSIALIASGLDLNTFKDHMCAHGHARGAQALADYLHWKIARPKIMTGSEFQLGVAQKTGIVFFKNITGFRGGEGDHIDLWNKDRAKGEEYASTSSQSWFWELE